MSNEKQKEPKNEHSYGCDCDECYVRYFIAKSEAAAPAQPVPPEKTGKDFLNMFLESENLPKLNPVLETVVLAAMAQFAQYRLARASSPAVAATKYKDVCDMLREMATEKPDMRLDVAASVLLGALIPVTQEDIKRGQEIAKELGLASPAVAGRTQGDERAKFDMWYKANYPKISGTSSWVERAWATWQAALRESAREAPSDITSKLRKLEPITACPKCEAETENEAMTECCGNDDCPMDGKWNEALASLNREQIFVEIELREEFPEAPAAPKEK